MRYILLLLFLKLSTLAFSQDRSASFQFKNAPLSEILTKIESDYNVRFSYKNELGGKYKINRDFKNTDLNHILTQLSEDLPINFQIINERYIAVKEIDQSVTINGSLVDKHTQEPLMAGTIVNIPQQKGCSSNQEGQFNLKNNQPGDTIAVRYIGYKTHKFRAENGSSNQSVKIEMEETLEQLEEVVVDCERTGIHRKKDGEMFLSASDLKVLSASADSDFFGALQQLPGINNPNETNAYFNIRGGTPDHNLILWNGITIYQNSHFFGMISVFNPRQIAGLKVFRSGAGVEYGNRIAGVIDMQSNRRIPERLGGSLGINGNFVEGLLRVPLRKEKVGITVSARRSYGDLFSTPTFDKYYDRVFQNTIISENESVESNTTSSNTDFYFEDLAMNSNFKLSDNSNLYLNYLYSKNSLHHQFAFDGIQENKYHLGMENHGLSLITETRMTNKLKHTFKADYSSYELNYSANIKSDQVDEPFKKNTIEKFGLEMEFLYQIDTYNKFKTGFQINELRVAHNFDENTKSKYSNSNNPILYTSDGKLKFVSLFSEYQWNLENIFYLNFGIRLNGHKRYGKLSIGVEPHLYARMQLTKSLYLKMNAGEKKQYLSQILEFNTYDFGLETQVWTIMEQNFPILKSKQLMTGIHWEQDKYSFDMEFYHNKTSGLNSYSRAFQNREERFSLGKSRTYGFDVHLKRKGKFSSYQLSYSYQDTEFNFPDMGDPFPGNFEMKHSVSASSNWFWKKFQFSLIWNWHTGKPYTSAHGFVEIDEEIFVNYDRYYSKRLPDYHRLDFNSSYRFSISKQTQMSLGFSVLNVYNHKCLLDRSYKVIHGDWDSLQKLDNYSLGITPNVFLRIDF